MHYFGIIGYGNMASYHHLSSVKPDEIKYKAAYDINEKRLERAQANGLIAYNTVEELLADDEIDTILVATPNDSHKEYAVMAMNAGKNVICEKPVALNSDELDEMIEASKRNNVFFTVHQNRRVDTDYRIIKKIYDENLIGDIFRIESRVQGSRGIANTWRRKKQNGGGMLYDWGVHLIDQLLYMIDSPVTSVFAEFQYLSQNEVDDNVRVNLTFKNGLSALVEIGTCNFIMLPLWYVTGKKGSAQIDYWDLSGKMNILIDDTINFEDEIKPNIAGPSITLAPRAEDTMKVLPLPTPEFDKNFFYKNILDVLDNGAPLAVRPEEFARSMKVIDLAFKSGTEKQVISCNI